MANNRFATAMDSVVEMNPKIKKARSTFNLGIKVYTSFNVGELVPLDWFEVLPGDTFNINLNMLLRMTSTSKRPPMDNLYCDVYAFFVPNRFLDKGWEEVQGASSLPWTQPTTTCSTLHFVGGTGDVIQAGSLLNHLGLPVIGSNNINYKFNIYPVYTYMKVVNDWWRDENVQADIAFDPTNNDYYITQVPQINSTSISSKGSLFRVAKFHDVFTSALPTPQKSSQPVKIPLGSAAPIMAVNNGSGTISAIQHLDLVNPDPIAANSSANPMGWNLPSGTGSLGPLYADLSQASAATINELRLAFQLQKAYELDARGGSARYTEAIENRFGVNNPDLRLGRSELLGHYRFPLNMNEVPTTSGADGTSATASNLLGTGDYLQGVGAGSSKTGHSQHICVKSFTEHGIVMLVCCVRPDLTYQQGIEKYWTKKSRFDFMEPIFSNIGEVPIMKSELYGLAIASDSVFAFQEAWYDYRYHQNHVSGILASDANTGFDIFHYAQDFPSAPNYGSTFIEQSSVSVDRTLAVDSSVCDQFILNAQGVVKATRIMPLFSIPGLIDHF